MKHYQKVGNVKCQGGNENSEDVYCHDCWHLKREFANCYLQDFIVRLLFILKVFLGKMEEGFLADCVTIKFSQKRDLVIEMNLKAGYESSRSLNRSYFYSER